MDIRDALSESIHTGFIDQFVHSNAIYRPELLVNDQKQGKKVLTTILRELEGCEEFWFSVAFVTTSGIATLMNTLIELEKANVTGKILASQYLNFTQPEALKRIKKFRNIDLRIAVEGSFHSKGYLFKKNGVHDLIIGSSNLTQTALCSNTEWNLKISATQESELIDQAVEEFGKEFSSAREVTDRYLLGYELAWKASAAIEKKIRLHRKSFQDVETLPYGTESIASEIVSEYELARKTTVALGNDLGGEYKIIEGRGVQPNLMQREALESIKLLRAQGKNKALLISATGTGKTYLSAFDVQNFKPERFLFIVHRRTIAEEAMKTFKVLLGDDIKMGIYSGKQQELDADYLFSTVQTMSKQDHLDKFERKHFNYVVIDETHRAGAKSYEKIMDHFAPDFLLGMTATPERTDGADIFRLFDHNIAYEIRLHRALAEGMLSPFHYYGVTDLTINGREIGEFTDFNLLTAKERVDRIIDKVELFGCDDGEVRGLVFCSRTEIAQQLSNEFNGRGYKTLALTGASTENERQYAIRQLESEQKEEKLDYIFTVDIFNEGIDIPKVNQLVMLRPTQSAIIFVQQLGRGLRKTDTKEYLTVIDFIGNYSNNYLVPIALYGDTSYNKDSLRKLMASGSSLIPGSSTINFDKISKERIFAAIDAANMQMKKDLVKDYDLLKFKLGHIPMTVDFLEHGSRDPQLYVKYSRSYFNFVAGREKEYKNKLDAKRKKLLELFSSEINNAKRIEETLILEMLIGQGTVDIPSFKAKVKEKFGHNLSNNTIESCLLNLNFEFVTENENNKKRPVRDIYGLNIVRREGSVLAIDEEFRKLLIQKDFKTFLIDSIEYAKRTYEHNYTAEGFVGGFGLYKKYTRKDVFRILNWDQNPVAQNVGGYIISKDKANCPIFVNYHKEENISSTTKYEDGFIDHSTFEWMSKSRRTLKSNDVKAIMDYRLGLRLPLFIKKSNDEGTEFYFMGDITPIDDRFEETKMVDDQGKEVSVVKVLFAMNIPVEDSIYRYLTNS